MMNKLKMNIGFIGAVGVPNVYGGFEMFLEVCGPSFAECFDNVFITCDKKRYVDLSRVWKGIYRVFIPFRANGSQSVIHDFLAFFSVFWRVRVIIVLGVSGGVFFRFFVCCVSSQARN